MKRLQRIWQVDPYLGPAIILALFASILSFGHFYRQGTITAFSDAQARLLISRSVISGLHAGLAQLGAVWPPIPQILVVPFVWNEFLYSSGIAGAIISMLSYIVAAAFLFKLIVNITNHGWAGIVGVVAFTSPSLLYMQSVPMSEVPFIAFFVMSVYFLMRWVQEVEKLQFLFLTALAVFFATLTRYEGWVLFWVVTAVLAYAFWKNRFSLAKAEGHFVFFATLALFGIGLWLLFNQVIFGDIFYFSRSEYSPWTIVQESLVGIPPSQRTSGNLALSLMVYGRTVIDNAGWIIAGLAIVGLVSFLFARVNSTHKLVILSLLFPFAFYVIALFDGNSVVILHPDFIPGANWGTRYGILMLPAIGFFVGFLAQKRKWLAVPILILIVSSTVITWQRGIISYDEAVANQAGSDAVVQRAAGDWLKAHYDGGLLLMQRTNNEVSTFASTLSLNKLVYEGDQDTWEGSLLDPARNGSRWIFMRENLNGQQDRVWRDLRGTPQLTENYDLVYQDSGVEIYRQIGIPGEN